MTWLGFALTSSWIKNSHDIQRKMVFVQQHQQQHWHTISGTSKKSIMMRVLRLIFYGICLYCIVYRCLSFHQCVHNSLISGGIYIFGFIAFEDIKACHMNEKINNLFYILSSLSERVWDFITKNMVFIFAQKKTKKRSEQKKNVIYFYWPMVLG